MHIPGVAMLWGHVFAGECSVAVRLSGVFTSSLVLV